MISVTFSFTLTFVAGGIQNYVIPGLKSFNALMVNLKFIEYKNTTFPFNLRAVHYITLYFQWKMWGHIHDIVYTIV